MHLRVSLTLPRDELTVPVARHVVRSSMRELGVERECIADLELALSEACTNVVKHSGPGDRYDVSLTLDPVMATLRVVDTGRGFDITGLGVDHATPTAEEGRGVQLMQALVDRLKFTSARDDGTTVHLQKQVAFEPDGAYAQLERRRHPT